MRIKTIIRIGNDITEFETVNGSIVVPSRDSWARTLGDYKNVLKGIKLGAIPELSPESDSRSDVFGNIYSHFRRAPAAEELAEYIIAEYPDYYLAAALFETDSNPADQSEFRQRFKTLSDTTTAQARSVLASVFDMNQIKISLNDIDTVTNEDTKLRKELWKHGSREREDRVFRYSETTRNDLRSSKIITAVDMPKNAILTPYDESVLRAIETMWYSKREPFTVTAPQLFQEITGREIHGLTGTNEQMLRDAMNHLAVRIEVDASELYENRRFKDTGIVTASIVSSIERGTWSDNGCRVIQWEILSAPLTYEHAARLGQLFHYKHELLTVGKVDRLTTILKDYVLDRIAVMPGQRDKSNYNHIAASAIKSVYIRQFGKDSYRHKKSSIEATVEEILAHAVKLGKIAGAVTPDGRVAVRQSDRTVVFVAPPKEERQESKAYIIQFIM